MTLGSAFIYDDLFDPTGIYVGTKEIKGVTFGLVFDGTTLTELLRDGSRANPEGLYSFHPRDIQHLSLDDMALGLFGRGKWPGGHYSWADNVSS